NGIGFVNIAVPLYPLLLAEFQYSVYAGRSSSACPRSAFVSCKHKMSGCRSAIKRWKVPFLTTARMPLTFHENSFIFVSIASLLHYLLMYRRIVLKLSGEQLSGKFDGGIDAEFCVWLAREVKAVVE